MNLDLDTVIDARSGNRPLDADALWAIPQVSAPEPRPGGHTEIAVSVTHVDVEARSRTSRIHTVDMSTGETRALTRPELNASLPRFSPAGDRLAFLGKPSEDSDRATQLYVLPIDGGEATRLTDLPLDVFDARWLPDGSGLVLGVWLYAGHLDVEATRTEHQRRKSEPVQVYQTEDRFYRFWDQWLVRGRIPHFFRIDVDGDNLTDLTPDSRIWLDWMEPADSFDLSADGKTLIFEGLHWEDAGGEDDRVRADVFRISTAKAGEPECLTAKNPANSMRPRFAPDGSIVYGKTLDPFYYADRPRLMRIDTEGTHHERLTDWDRAPSGWKFGSDGTLYFTAEDDARNKLWRLAPGADEPEVMTPELSAGGLAVDGEQVFFLRQCLSAPPEVWRLPASGGDPQRVTRFTEKSMSAVSLGEVRDARFEGANGDRVQMFLVMPPGYEEGKSYPLVHLIHGGPHGTFGNVWHMRWNAQVIANAGYLCAMVNFHGSTSWGNEFGRCIQGAWGDLPYTDVMAATDALVEAGIADEARMAVTGGSYGGYLTTWITSQTDRFACAINHAGVYDANLEMAGDVTWGWDRAFGGAVWKDPENVDRYNPVRHSSGVSTPTLVIHGELDYRVPVNNALLCYGILQAKGVPSRLVYFSKENHWILDPKSSVLWYGEFTRWLDRWLKSD